MKKLGPKKIAYSEHYDVEDDVYSVTFKTGEPSMVMEVDDTLLIEVGIFTKMPTGFRILNFRKGKVKVAIFQKTVGKIMKEAKSQFELASHFRGTTIESSIEKLLGSK